MPDLTSLQPLAQQNLPSVAFAGSTPLERMINGFQQAKKYMVALVPAGYTLDYDAALLTSEAFASQIDQKRAVVQTAFQTSQDLAQQDGLTTDHQGSREYWLSQYAIASRGIGAYASGAMQAAVDQRPGWTQIDYDESIQHRIEIFSSIVHAGDQGYLAALVSPDAYAQSVVMNSPQGALMTRSGQLPPSAAGSIITVSSSGNKVAVPVSAGGASGLGIAPIVLGAYVVVAIGIAIVAGVTVYYIQKKKIETSAALAAQICTEAIQSGNKDAISACERLASDVTEPKSAAETLFGGDIQQYLIWGGVALAGIYFAPMIVQSAMGVQSLVMKKNRRRRRRRR